MLMVLPGFGQAGPILPSTTTIQAQKITDIMATQDVPIIEIHTEFCTQTTTLSENHSAPTNTTDLANIMTPANIGHLIFKMQLVKRHLIKLMEIVQKVP